MDPEQIKDRFRRRVPINLVTLAIMVVPTIIILGYLGNPEGSGRSLAGLAGPSAGVLSASLPDLRCRAEVSQNH